MILRSALILLLLTVPVCAESDHDRAHYALAQGTILPLSTMLPGLERQFDARLLSAELDSNDGRLVYEFEMITPRGHILELTVDASTGDVIGSGEYKRHHGGDDD